MSEDELKPMVYNTWPNMTGKDFNVTMWPHGYDVPATPKFLNKTAVDDVFGFGEKYGRTHPVFPKYPLTLNTILNYTEAFFGDSLYLLATSQTSTYMLCSMRQSQTPNCSTEYWASSSGGSLSSRCEDENDQLSYHRSDSSATNGVLNGDWINVAIDWAQSISLGSGITDDNASNPRLLSQLIPTSAELNPSLPTIAEALAVLACSTLIMSTKDAPFIHYWNYSATVPTLKIPQYQGFNATVSFQDYASGGTQRWQNIFYIVLILVFATNVICFGYFLYYGGLVTDFIEPQNLFALSLNSPPSQRLEGSCGGGPEKEQLRTSYFIKLQQEHEHFYIQEGASQPAPKVRKRCSFDLDADASPVANIYSKLSNKRMSLL